MHSSRRWKEINFSSEPSEPAEIKIKINSREAAEQGDRLIRRAQRPLDIKERERAIKRATSTAGTI